jgi:H+-translocating NAD(P) transhydrogenase subunit alpha
VSQELILGIYVFIMAIFVGFEVISRVPSVLHTPLMSGTNAIHGIVVLGAFLVAGSADTPLLHVLGFIAVVFGAANVFGGFFVTDRMLEMFKKRETVAPKTEVQKKNARCPRIGDSAQLHRCGGSFHFRAQTTELARDRARR